MKPCARRIKAYRWMTKFSFAYCRRPKRGCARRIKAGSRWVTKYSFGFCRRPRRGCMRRFARGFKYVTKSVPCGIKKPAPRKCPRKVRVGRRWVIRYSAAYCRKVRKCPRKVRVGRRWVIRYHAAYCRKI